MTECVSRQLAFRTTGSRAVMGRREDATPGSDGGGL